MEFNKKQPALLYLDKNGFYFYEPGLQGVISLAFLETSVKDMDVINGASLMNQIKGFIEQYRIIPSLITIVLSPNITFEKEIVGLPLEEQEEQIKKFIDTIPFESTLTKNYPIDKGVKVIGCNEDMFQELKISFEKSGFTIENVVPYQLLGNNQQLIKNLITENAIQFLRHVGGLRQASMLQLEKDKEKTQITPDANKNESQQPKKSRMRLYAMAVVFVILFIILGVMLLKR